MINQNLLILKVAIKVVVEVGSEYSPLGLGCVVTFVDVVLLEDGLGGGVDDGGGVDGGGGGGSEPHQLGLGLVVVSCQMSRLDRCYLQLSPNSNTLRKFASTET